MTPADMAALLRELGRLEQAAAVITSRDDLVQVDIWQAVVRAIAERRARLIADAEKALVSEPVVSDAQVSITSNALADLPPGGRVH